MVEHLILPSLEVLCIFKVVNQLCNLRANYQPPLEGTRVGCKTNKPSITLDASIFLLMCLIDEDYRDDPVALLNCEIGSIKLSGKIWVYCW
jgi:hypothetical protein